MKNDSAIQSITSESFFSVIGDAFRKASLCALIIGSYPEGLATPASDIDVMLVIDDERFLALKEQNVESVKVAGVRLDVLLVRRSVFEEYAVLAKSQLGVEDLRAVELVHKTMNGIVFHGMDWYKRIREGFDEKHFQTIVRNRFLLEANDEYGKLIGMLQGRHVLTALSMTRTFMESTLDAYLASIGDTYPKNKWRMRKLERNVDRNLNLFQEICAVEFNAPYTETIKALAWIDESFRTIQQIQLGIYFGSDIVIATSQLHESTAPNQIISSPMLSIEILPNAFAARLPHRQIAIDRITAATLLLHSRRLAPDQRINLLQRYVSPSISTSRFEDRLKPLLEHGFLVRESTANDNGWASIYKSNNTK